MAKVTYSIRVDNCRDCPYMREDHVMGGAFCAEEPTYSNIRREGIPDWCPLPDEPEGEGD